LSIGAAQIQQRICQRTDLISSSALEYIQHLRRISVRHSEQILNRNRGPAHQLRHHCMRRGGPHRCCRARVSSACHKSRCRFGIGHRVLLATALGPKEALRLCTPKITAVPMIIQSSPPRPTRYHSACGRGKWVERYSRIGAPCSRSTGGREKAGTGDTVDKNQSVDRKSSENGMNWSDLSIDPQIGLERQPLQAEQPVLKGRRDSAAPAPKTWQQQIV